MKSKLTRILFGSAMLALLACQAAAEGKISGITAQSVSDGLQVQVKGTDLTAPRITRTTGGRSFILEFDASLTSDPQWLRVEQGGVHYVQSVWSQSNPPKIRIHLRVDPGTQLSVGQNSNGYMLKVTHSEATPHTAAPNNGLTTIPQTVPTAPEKITIYKEPLDLHTAPAPAPAHHVTVFNNPGHASHSGPSVSLDFVNTDVVQVLKALAMEAGVNIVTAPDVKGAITVSLGHVSVEEALNLITTMASVKYAQVGNTYVVTNASNMGSVTKELGVSTPENAVTRVVPIYSGEATHIKSALLATNNDIEILLPSDKPIVGMQNPAAMAQTAGFSQPQQQQQAAAAANAANQAGANNSQSQNTPVDTRKDAYLVLVGPASRVDNVEAQVKQLDEEMCHVVGVDYPMANVMIRQIYHPQGSSAAMLLKSVASSLGPNAATASTSSNDGGLTHAQIGFVECFATPSNSTSAQNIVLYGRETEVNRLMETLTSIDKLSEQSGDYVVYDVKYLDPRALREDLITRFPGLAVTIPPSSVGNPAVYQEGREEQQAAERASQQLGATVSNSNQSTNQQSTTTSANGTVTGDSGQNPGLTFPFASQEAQSVPMKLVLHGAADQIQNAISYLNAIDTEPKQVALEMRVMELSKEDALNLGLDWSLLTGGTVKTFRMNQGSGNTADSPGTVSGLLGFHGGGSLSVTATLDQLAGTNHMIARPNLLALDGRESEMFVGDDVKYIQSIQASQNGTTVTTGDVEVGVKLAVLPRVGADGSITMDLRPMVSTLKGFTPVPGGGELPQTGLRIAQSTMVIHSGETIAIGGLIQDQDSKQISGIPILKDLPLIGMLFSRTNNTHNRTEVVFFLTAKTVDQSDLENAANPMRHGGGDDHRDNGGHHRRH